MDQPIDPPDYCRECGEPCRTYTDLCTYCRKAELESIREDIERDDDQ